MKRIQDEFIGALILVSLFALSIPTFAQTVQGRISSVGDATHLEFQGLATWKYETSEEDKAFVLTIPAFDDKTLVELQTWSDKYISKITVDKNGPDNNYLVRFDLNSKEVEVFDYLTDQPSRVILDFYQKAPEPVAEKPLPKKKAKAVVSKPANSAGTEYKKVERNVASSEILQAPIEIEDLNEGNKYPTQGIFDGGDPDYSRFELKDYAIDENAIIASRQNIYIRFPYLTLQKDRFAEMMKDRPEYEIREKDTEENKEARLLITLHKKKRFGSFVKVYDHFLKKFPKSQYEEIVRNLAVEQFADRYMETGDRQDYDMFRNILKYLVETYPGSPLDERNRLLLGYSAMRMRDGLQAIQEFENFLKKYPQSEEKDRVQIARAEAYLALRKPKEARKVLVDLETETASERISAEAAYRQGDLHMEFQEYKDAAKVYESQIQKYPAYKSIYPNAQYNLSESYFWMKDYKKSLDHFIEYLKLFPAHSHGGFALTRVGELLEILGGDQRQIMGAFIEGYFRFPKSAGSDVARVRMLTGALRNMKQKQRDIAFKELGDVLKRSDLPKIEEFTTLLVADGLSKGQEYETSLKTLESYYQKNPTTAAKSVFEGRILRNLSDILKTKLDSNQFIEALDLHGKYSTTWLRRSDRVDTEFFHAKAFEQAGVFKEAKSRYAKILKRLKKMAGTKEHKERRVYEHLPSQDQVSLRLAATALAQKNYRDAFTHLSHAKANLSDTERVEKVQIGAELAVQTGDHSSAIGYLKQLVANWKGQPELLIQPYLRLAKLHLDQSNWAAAEMAMQAISQLPKEALSAEPVVADRLQLQAELNLGKGNKEKAVENYLELLAQFESKRPLESVRYKAGEIKFEAGDVKGAEQIWSGLNKDSAGLYAKMAEEKLKQSQWEEEYKKYIDRIPAAEQLK